MDVIYEFVPYGERFDPQPATIVLDVGMRTVPGVIDHHHPEAEPECTASLIVKHPGLVLDHLGLFRTPAAGVPYPPLRIITHRLPDFDSLASIFLTLQLLETGQVNPSLEKIARYTRMVDSASIPKEVALSSTPYSILRALFAGARKEEAEINQDRLAEGLKFMRFLYARSEEGYEIEENRRLFSGIDRYERAMRKVDNDYFQYLNDLSQAQKIVLDLPLSETKGRRRLDGLIVRNPSSFLLKEWSRRDLVQPSLKQGFSLLVTSFGTHRYILGVDPEMGVNLRGLGGLLNQKEEERRRAEDRPMAHRWYEGNCPFFNYRIIDSPRKEPRSVTKMSSSVFGASAGAYPSQRDAAQQDEVGQLPGQVTDRFVRDSIWRRRLEPQIDRIIDIIHHYENAGIGQGDLRGEKVKTADTGDSQCRGCDRRQAKQSILFLLDRRINMSPCIPPEGMDIASTEEHSKPGRPAAQLDGFNMSLKQVVILGMGLPRLDDLAES